MKLSTIAKKTIIIICILLFMLIVAAGIYYRSLSSLPFILGAILGSSVCIIKVILLENAIDKSLEMDNKAAGNYLQLQHILRLFLTGGAMMIAVFVPFISLWGTAAGIFTFQMSLFFLNLSTKKKL